MRAAGVAGVEAGGRRWEIEIERKAHCGGGQPSSQGLVDVAGIPRCHG